MPPSLAALFLSPFQELGIFCAAAERFYFSIAGNGQANNFDYFINCYSNYCCNSNVEQTDANDKSSICKVHINTTFI